MEQEFLLKQYGHFSLFELSLMTAESRNWHIQRLDKEFKKKQKQQEGK